MSYTAADHRRYRRLKQLAPVVVLGQEPPRTGAQTPCCYGRCPLTLAGHEVAPPRAGTYHERVWKRQVRAEVKHIDGQGGRWHACAVRRVWVPE